VGVVGGLGAAALAAKGVWKRGVTLPNGAGLAARPLLLNTEAVTFRASVLVLVLALGGQRALVGSNFDEELG
jgi:hypothetical protein